MAPGKGFSPTPAPVAPAGTYDPNLDASARAADRGLLYGTQDAERDKERLSTSYVAGKDSADTQQKYSLADLLSGKNRGEADLLTGKNRSLADLLTASTREGQDYGRLSGDLARNYAELGAGQTATASKGAFVDTGSIAAAGAQRAENQGRDQGVLDLSHSRFGEDNTRDTGRVNEDYNTGFGRMEEDYGTGVERANKAHDDTVGELGRQLQYGTDDLATSLQRSGFENNFFHQDTDAAKMYQATTSGLYTPPEKPSNEFSDSKGPYRLVVAHGLRFKERPNGVREAAGVAS